MSKELAVTSGAVSVRSNDWDVMREQAKTLVDSKFLPPAISTWQKAVAVMMYGKELGMGPMEALQSIDVIQGKPTQKPQSMKAMVHKKLPSAIFRLIKCDKDECIMEAARPGDPPVQYSFTWEDAEKLGLSTKENYRKQPKVMLQWRCIGHVARTVFPDCLSGVSYTPEELGAEVDDEHNVIKVAAEEKKPETAPPPPPPPPPPPKAPGGFDPKDPVHVTMLNQLIDGHKLQDYTEYISSQVVGKSSDYIKVFLKNFATTANAENPVESKTNDV